jgi:hypothetical protein
MGKNPLLIICLFLFLRQQNRPLPALSTLQLESLIDQVHTMIHTMEKVNSFAKSDVLSSLPDMKKMLEVVEKIPL